MGELNGADLAAILATVMAIAATVPQVRRIVVTGDIAGVSLASATIGLTTELAWATYAIDARLWLAVPEAVAMVVANGLVAAMLWRAGASAGRALLVALAWGGVLAATAVLAGTVGLGVLLGVAYLFQAAPAVWTACRTPVPSGVAACTWALVGAESVLWGVYGIANRDPAITTFAVVGALAASAIVARKLATRATTPLDPFPATAAM